MNIIYFLIDYFSFLNIYGKNNINKKMKAMFRKNVEYNKIINDIFYI